MEKKQFLKTLFFKTEKYSNFVANDFNSALQKQLLIKICTLQYNYTAGSFKNSEHARPNYNIATSSTIDWNFEVFKMKKCILNELPYKINFKVTPILTKQTNRILLLAMIMDHEQIVKYLMGYRLIDINDSIFGAVHWPSYFLLACSCSNRIFNIFAQHYINFAISWGGITPHLLCCFSDKKLSKPSDLDYLTYQEFYYLNLYRGLHLKMPKRNYPIFLLDFICMLGNTSSLREILERVPEAGALSYLSFLIQNKDHLILIMTRYGFNEMQEYNGMTPLHMSCKNNDLFTLIFLMYSGFPIVKNDENKFPNEIAESTISYRVKAIFKIATSHPFYDQTIKKQRKLFYKDIFKKNNAQVQQILNTNDSRNVGLWEVFKYLDFNTANRIYKKSRFNIVSIFSSVRSPLSVENETKRILDYFDIMGSAKDYHQLNRKYNTNFKKLPN
ncbi:hypothetical protein NUSPORA_01816 [Nucleospora cyclopteri]